MEAEIVSSGDGRRQGLRHGANASSVDDERAAVAVVAAATQVRELAADARDWMYRNGSRLHAPVGFLRQVLLLLWELIPSRFMVNRIRDIIVVRAPPDTNDSRDGDRSSAVSAAFRSAAGADTVWERFLPSDYPSILSRASSPVEYSSKTELFFRLCDHPILIDDGNLTFGLERSSGAKCYMLSARALSIVWSHAPEYWTWIPLSNARFSEGAELLAVCWLDISGRIESKVLSPKTTYAAYLVFKLAEQSYGLSYPRQEACVTIGSRTSTRTVRLQDSARDMRRRPGWNNIAGEEGIDGAVKSPQERQEDGWMEMEMGEFYNDTGEDGEVAISLKEIRGGNWKRGLIIQGIEIRPKLP